MFDRDDLREECRAERAWQRKRERQFQRALLDPQEWEDWMDELADEEEEVEA